MGEDGWASRIVDACAMREDGSYGPRLNVFRKLIRFNALTGVHGSNKFHQFLSFLGYLMYRKIGVLWGFYVVDNFVMQPQELNSSVSLRGRRGVPTPEQHGSN